MNGLPERELSHISGADKSPEFPNGTMVERLSDWPTKNMVDAAARAIGTLPYPLNEYAIARTALAAARDTFDTLLAKIAEASTQPASHDAKKPPEFPPGFDKPYPPSGGKVA